MRQQIPATRPPRLPRGALAATILLASLHLAHADPKPDSASDIDLQQIEEGDPITLQDDLTNDPGELSLQYSDMYVRTHDPDARETQEHGPSLKLGTIKNVQVSINPNYQYGRGSQRNAGDVVSDILVHINDQTRLLPALGFDLFYSAPFGAGPKSPAYIFRAIASHSIGAGADAPRLHLNLTDTHLFTPGEGARKDQPQIVFGGSFLPTPKGALVADIIYGAAEGHGTETLGEIGYTRLLYDGWIGEVGAGKQITGFGNETRFFFSIEKDVSVF